MFKTFPRLVLVAVWVLAALNAGSQTKLPVAAAKLLVVAPVAFEQVLRPLIEHKNRTGMPAEFLSMEAVRKSEEPGGGNDAEKLKLAIYNHWIAGTRYVMLVGDMSLIPCCRRSVENLPGNPDALIWRYGYVTSELFYENLLSSHEGYGDETVKSRKREITYWDRNANSLYNEQHWGNDPVTFNPDQVDGYPDIAVGRIPAHTPEDVQRYVQKIIRYETQPNIGLDHATFFYGKSYDGSYGMSKDIVDHSSLAEKMPPNAVTLFGLSNRGNHNESGEPAGMTTADEPILTQALTRSLFLGYLGHGAPTSWDAALLADGRSLDLNEKTIPAALHNAFSLPIVLSVGCETGRHSNNVPHDEYRDVNGVNHWFWWGDKSKNADHKVVDIDTGQFWDSAVTVPTPSVYDLAKNQPRTFAYYWLCKSADSGSIAFLGEEVVCQNDLGRDLITEILSNYKPGEYHADRKWYPSGAQFVLGDLWLQGQRSYWKKWHDFNGDNSVFRNARIYLGIMNLYGDPSLRLPILAH